MAVKVLYGSSRKEFEEVADKAVADGLNVNWDTFQVIGHETFYAVANEGKKAPK